MSEFTDYLQLLTHAESLADLQGQLEETVGAAYVPLLELPSESLETLDAADAAWRALPKPAWVMVHADSGLDALASLGPVFHLTVEEDFATWAVAVRCQGRDWAYAVLRAPDAYREATLQYDAVLWDGDAASAAFEAMAACLAVDPSALAATMVADGGQAFSALVGAVYAQMEDQTLTEYAPSEVRFAVWE